MQRPARTGRRKPKAQQKSSALDIERMRQDYEEQGTGDNKYFRFADGRTQLRLLMNPHNGLFYVHIVHAFIPGADGKTRVVSPVTNDPDAYCPVAEAYSALMRSGRKDEAKAIRPSNRYFMNAVVKKDGKWKPVWLECPHMVWKDIIRATLDEIDEDDDVADASDLANIADDKTGRMITVRRTTTGQRTEYETTVTTKKIPAKREWLSNRSDFTEETIPTDVEEIESVLCEYLGIDEISDLIGDAEMPDDDADEEVEDDTEEKDDDEDESDDDEEDGDDEYDDEEEDEEDEPKEEKPKRKKRLVNKDLRRTSRR